MRHNTCPSNHFFKASTRLVLVFISMSITLSAFSQKEYRFTKQQYQKKGVTALVVGGVLIVGGTIGTVAYDQPKLWNPWAQPVPINYWPVVVAGGTVISIIGLDHLIKSKRVVPMVEKQHIPGLDHMGIVYPKLPAIGIKYRL